MNIIFSLEDPGNVAFAIDTNKNHPLNVDLLAWDLQARRRQRFENRQDIKKRKQQEKGQKKFRYATKSVSFHVSGVSDRPHDLLDWSVVSSSGCKSHAGRLRLSCDWHRDIREKYLVTYEEMHTDTPPFVDLFTGEVFLRHT